MKTLVTLLKTIPLSLISGAILGALTSYAYYFLIAESEAENLQGLAKAEYLHSAGETLDVFIILGVFLGLGFGMGISAGLFLERHARMQRGDSAA